MSFHGFPVHVFSLVLQRQADHVVVLKAVVQGLHFNICTVAPRPRCWWGACMHVCEGKKDDTEDE